MWIQIFLQSREKSEKPEKLFIAQNKLYRKQNATKQFVFVGCTTDVTTWIYLLLSERSNSVLVSRLVILLAHLDFS